MGKWIRLWFSRLNISPRLIISFQHETRIKTKTSEVESNNLSKWYRPVKKQKTSKVLLYLDFHIYFWLPSFNIVWICLHYKIIIMNAIMMSVEKNWTVKQGLSSRSMLLNLYVNIIIIIIWLGLLLPECTFSMLMMILWFFFYKRQRIFHLWYFCCYYQFLVHFMQNMAKCALVTLFWCHFTYEGIFHRINLWLRVKNFSAY